MRILLIISLALAFHIFAAELLAEKSPKTKIGVSLPMTGPAATYGQDGRKMLEFANQKLAGGRYELLFYDDKCSGKDAVTVAHKLLDVDKVNFVIGPLCSGSVLSAAPLYNKAQAVAISPGGSAPEIVEAGEYIFRTWPNDSGAAKKLYEYLDKKHKSVGVVSEETDYAQGISKALQEIGKGRKLRLTFENFVSGNTDFRSQLLKLKQQKVDGLVLNVQAEEGLVVLVQQVRRMGWDLPLYAIFFAGSPTFLDNIQKQDAEGIVFVDTPLLSESMNAEGAKLYQEYIAEYGKPGSVEFYFMTVLEAFNVLDQSIRSEGDPREFILGREFGWVAKGLRFDKNGDVLGIKHVLKVVRDGKVELMPST